MPLTPEGAILIGFACEAICWGLYLLLFLAALVLTLRRLHSHGTNIPIVTSMCALFLLCTAHFAIEFNHFYTVLTTMGVEAITVETKPQIGADILFSICDLLGDFILLYRCWIVWDRNYWVIIVPSLTAVAGFACIMELAHVVVTLDPTAPFAPTFIIPLGIAGYSLPLVTNVIATALIVYKLWWMLRAGEDETLTISSSAGRMVKNAAAIIVESGLLYLVAQLVVVVLFSLGHLAQPIAVFITVQIYGIAPTLIIIRVALGITSEQTVHHISTAPSAWRVHVHPVRATRSDVSGDTCEVVGQSMEMKAFGTSQADLGGHVVV